ncbi:hypothetical protein BGX38DRAFT_596298 [Terfezia claveryi]|nr:hypothetical protein BGX38DRAFT_596298 [Terfezia claveryi]
MVDGGVSESAPVQNQIRAPPTVSKKRKVGQLELKDGKSGAVDNKSRGKERKRGNGDKEALGEPIGTHPETTAQLPSESVKNVSVMGNNARTDAAQKKILALPSTTSLNITGNITGNPGFAKGGVPIASVKQMPEEQGQQIFLKGLQQPVSTAVVPVKQLLAPGKRATRLPGKLVSSMKLSTSIQPHESSVGIAESASGLLRANKNLKSGKKPNITTVKKTAPPPPTLDQGINTSRHLKPAVTLGFARDSRVTDFENNTTETVTEGIKKLQQKGDAIIPRTVANSGSTASNSNGVGRGLGTFNTLFLSRPHPKLDEKEKIPFAVPRKKLVLAMKPAQTKPSDHMRESKSIRVEDGASLEAPLSPTRQDTEINWKLIRFPPRVGFRRRIETISRVLALVAHHSSTLTSPAGTFLRNTVTLNKVWYYSSILAYYHLSLCEFGGTRTSQWIKLKRADIARADFREWYWHRVQLRELKMQMVEKKWWGERILREYILANGLQREYGKHGNSENGGLWCSGAINMDLLNENETIGQWDIAARFWAGRFCAAMFSGEIGEGGRNMEMILGCGEYAVEDACPVGENGEAHGNVSAGATVSDVWEVVTKGAGTYIIIGGTGEVIGTLQAAEHVRRKGLKRLRSPELRTGTIIGTGGTSRFRKFTNLRDHSTLQKLTDCWDDVSWHSLRLDWRAYVSKLLAYAAQPKPQGLRGATAALQPESITKPVPLLLSHLYHPSPKQFKHGIHENIILRHHRVVAERFILAHAEEYGFSGGVGNPISGGTKVGLDLDSKWRVESVLCSGEKMEAIGGRVERLGNGVAFVQTAEGGWYVLEDTGEIIAQEEYGISGVWATILGVDERGFDAGRKGFLELRGLFRSN